jgi:hypothetical protein
LEIPSKAFNITTNNIMTEEETSNMELLAAVAVAAAAAVAFAVAAGVKRHSGTVLQVEYKAKKKQSMYYPSSHT